MTTYNELSDEDWSNLRKLYFENTVTIFTVHSLIKRKFNLRYLWYKCFQREGYEFTPDEVDKVLNILNYPSPPTEDSDKILETLWMNIKNEVEK